MTAKRPRQKGVFMRRADMRALALAATEEKPNWISADLLIKNTPTEVSFPVGRIMSSQDEQQVSNTNVGDEQGDAITDLKPRKMSNVDETDDETSESGDSQEGEGDAEEGEISTEDVKDAAMDILDQLVELFIEQNGREPNEEEVLQWIDVFKSLKIDDGNIQEFVEQAGEGADGEAANAAAE